MSAEKIAIKVENYIIFLYFEANSKIFAPQALYEEVPGGYILRTTIIIFKNLGKIQFSRYDQKTSFLSFSDYQRKTIKYKKLLIGFNIF